MKQIFRMGNVLGEDVTLGVVETVGESMADQSFREECDINTLVKRFGITGNMNGAVLPPPIEEFGEIFDFQSAMNLINAADRAFMSLDADVRARFNNDPARYVSFCSERDDDGNLRNIEEMRRLGLALPAAEPPKEPAPVRVQVVNPTP